MSVDPKQPLDITHFMNLQKIMLEGMTKMHQALSQISKLPMTNGVEMQTIAQATLNDVESDLFSNNSKEFSK